MRAKQAVTILCLVGEERLLMPIYSLTPLDLDNPNWVASSHRGRAIVRAANEHEARAVAAQAFDLKTGFRPGGGRALSALDAPNLGQSRARQGSALRR